MAEKFFQLLYVYLRKNVKPPVRHKAPVADKAMQMRVKIYQVAEGLDSDHSPWHGISLIQSLTEELLERLVGAFEISEPQRPSGCSQA